MTRSPIHRGGDVSEVTDLDRDDLAIGECYDHHVVALVLFSLLELLLVALFYGAAFAILWHFGGGLEPGRRHCPACQRDGLSPLEPNPLWRGQLTVHRCSLCGVAYREQLDGTLVAMPDS